MKARLMFFVFLWLCVSTAMAQERTVTGTVKGKDDGLPLPGVSIRLKGSSVGTQTGPNGQFSLRVPDNNSVLMISYVGYSTQQISVGSRSNLNVILSADATQLGEVVVTGLGINRDEKAIGYSAQKVSGADLSQVRDVNVVNSLSGRVAGVQVGVNSGAMGGSAKISIRGVTSLFGNNNPLFVVDGIPMENNNTNSTEQQRGAGGYDYGNSIQDINPNDIQDVTVLKGAAATALYGSRGGNGVIVITTKKGGAAKGMGLSYTFGANMDKVYKLPKYQNRYGGGYGFNKLYYNENPEAFPEGRQGAYDDGDGKGSYDLLPDYDTDESWGPKYEGQLYRPYWSWDKDKGNPNFGQLVEWKAQPDNIRNFFETGTTLTHTVALDGSGDKGSYRVSYSNFDQGFILPNSNLDRHNASFNGVFNASKKLTVSASANYVTHTAVGRPGTGYDGSNVMQQFTQWGQRQIDFGMLKNYAYEDGTQITWNRSSWSNPAPKYTDNPYWTRHKNFQNDGRNRFFGNVSANYKVTDYLKAEIKYMTDTYSETQEERIAIGSQDIPAYRLYELNHTENNLQALLSIDKNLSDAFSINASVGANRMVRNRAINDSKSVGGLSSDVYNLGASVGRPDITDTKSQKQINSVFASASFGYNRMLYLDLAARNDWSSTLPSNNNSYFYPSVSLSWVASEVLKNDMFDFLKFRAAIAQVGNDTDPYNILLAYDLRQPFGSSSRVSYPNTLPNSILKPEITTEYEFGTEFRLLKNRLGLNFSYYNKQTRDQIIPLSQSAATGATFKYINAGKIENKGVEVSLTGSPVKTNDFSWDITVNWARNRNKILELTPSQKTFVLTSAPFAVQLQAREGESFGSIVGYDYVYDDQGRKVVLASGLYQRSAEQKVLGSVLPDYTGGVTNSFRYKGISLNALIDFQKGGSFFSTTQMFGRSSGILEESAEGSIREDGVIAEGVKADGTPNDKVVDAPTHFLNNGGYRINAADVIDASYIYLREMSLGYALPSAIVAKTPFHSARISLVGRNLLLLKSNSKHVDPSNVTNSITNIQGIEGGALPSIRTFGFTLSLGL